MDLTRSQADILNRLAAKPAGWELNELAAALGMDQSPLTADCQTLAQLGLLTIQETPYDEISATRDAAAFQDREFPECLVAKALWDAGGAARITDLPAATGLTSSEVGQSVRWLSDRGWGRKAQDQLQLTSEFRPEVLQNMPERAALAQLSTSGPQRRPVVGISDAELDRLVKRKLVQVRARTERRVALTPQGKAALDRGIQARGRVRQLTPELLTEGRWREVDFQPYDVTLSARTLYPGKDHPYQRTLDKVRRVFLELGFEEVSSPWVESSFWDFDALFQPQDHPARDMQDTFYVERPASCRLPEAGLVDRVRATHENGGDTGSTGWQYRWRVDLAHRPVLRTHTTAATVRALAAHAKRGGPGKYFVIGPVFRRETVDYKHLPVFYQVDGIVIDPTASLATLLALLGAFYEKMGFPKIRFRPSFFPYTEPSAEVFLWMEGRQEWIEMGGSGILRPEVTLPLGVKDRVLAWGLGLERLAMMIHGLQSIGELYFATMPWLREAPLARS